MTASPFAAPEYHECDNCATIFPEEELCDIEDLHLRIDPKGTVPSGECPCCRCLCYPEVLGVLPEPSLI